MLLVITPHRACGPAVRSDKTAVWSTSVLRLCTTLSCSSSPTNPVITSVASRNPLSVPHAPAGGSDCHGAALPTSPACWVVWRSFSVFLCGSVHLPGQQVRGVPGS